MQGRLTDCLICLRQMTIAHVRVVQLVSCKKAKWGRVGQDRTGQGKVTQGRFVWGSGPVQSGPWCCAAVWGGAGDGEPE